MNKSRLLYESPAMTIVEVKTESTICNTSPGEASVQNYTWHNEDEE